MALFRMCFYQKDSHLTILLVNLFVLQLDPEEDDFRYVPDLLLMDLKAEAAELERIKEERKKK